MGRIPVIREGREQAVASKAPPLPVTTASDGFDAPAPADLLEQVIELRRSSDREVVVNSFTSESV